jgi:hypothetical protein
MAVLGPVAILHTAEWDSFLLRSKPCTNVPLTHMKFHLHYEHRAAISCLFKITYDILVNQFIATTNRFLGYKVQHNRGL